MAEPSSNFTSLFDERGNLKPYQVIEMTMVKFEEVFSNGFPGPLTRQELLKSFRTLCKSIHQQVNNEFTIWVDGSFATQKLDPNDIDCVFFIGSTDYQIHEKALRQLVNREYCRERGLDCYFVRVYPSEHPNYLIETDADRKEWLSLFSRTRVHRNGKRYPKGIVQLSF
ncbi:hypothetical protein GCM10028808_04190 [Spirosoma migulaei]